MMDEKGQASMEMLLLVAGAIVIAVIVGIIIKTSVQETVIPMVNEQYVHAAEGY